ncbi:MAG TPA: alpha/beta hydrolase, partial [Anaerolineales bacterium]|nr:alpha/beta hydrolase [Anaerolineales bacterium]
WWAANYASRYPQRVASLALLEPVFVFTGLKPALLLKLIPATLPFAPKSYRDAVLKEIGGSQEAELDLEDPVVRMIALGSEAFVRHIPMPVQITPEQMQAWEMPVYAAMAANSALHDSEQAAAAARANVRQVQVKNWPGASHSLPMEFPAEIDAELLDFMQASEASR